MFTREKTRRVRIGNTYIGGDNRVLIQSMCNIKTEKVHEVVKQINDSAALGANLMRVSVLDEKDAYAIREIKKGITIPLIADIHFDYRLAILAMESGVDKIRINPGNILDKDGLVKIIEMAKEKGVAIRIGVNSGSLEKAKLKEKNNYQVLEMMDALRKAIKLCEDHGFYNIVISLKASDLKKTIMAYTMASEEFDYPLHLGITEAGIKDISLIRSSACLSPMLLNGIGNTIRISMSEDVLEEVKACKRLLHDLGLYEDYPTFISCPTCGRTQIDLIPLANKVSKYLENINKKITVAIMGCPVNGPGEASYADIGIAGAKDRYILFAKGKPIGTLKDEKSAYEALVSEIDKLVKN